MDSSLRPDWRSSLTGAGDALQASARAAPEAAALVGSDAGWTYRELDRAARRLGARLGESIAPGERVGILMDPGPVAVLAVHAVPRAGGVIVPLHPQWSAPELVACVEALGIRRVLTDTRDRAVPDGAVADPVGLEALDPLDQPTDDVPVPPSPRDPAHEHTIIWTSGTTGRPRGVALSALNHVASAVAVTERLGLRPTDRWALTLSPAYIGGLALILRAAATGAVVVAPGPLGAERLAELLEAGHVSHASLVPTQLARLLDVRGDRPSPHGLRLLLIGGAAPRGDLLERALALGYPIALTYGLSEAASQVATAPPALARRKPGTVGPPLRSCEVRIAADGEILVRGPTVMRGYVGADDQAVRSGWLYTGDLGRRDPEGDLWITGRKTSRILSGGASVDPLEVETVLRSHPGVRDVMILGLADAEWGEVVAAAVVASGADDDLAAALDAWCRDRLAPAKRPRRYVTLAALPLGANGKIDRDAVRARLAGGA